MTWICRKATSRLSLNVALVAVSVSFAVATTAARAQDAIPALPELPAQVAAGRPDLVSQRARLLGERQALRAKKESYNAACSAVEEGSAQEASCRSAGSQLRAEITAHIRQSKDFNATVKAAGVAQPWADPSVVDARGVPTGLPPSVEAQIPDTPAGKRLRKGFQAVLGHDWKVALAWFQDALLQDPGNAGIERLIDLAQYTIRRRSEAGAAATAPAPVADQAARDQATLERIDRLMDKQLNEDLAKALRDFEQSHPEPPPERVTANWKAFFDALFKKPARTSGIGAVRD